MVGGAQFDVPVGALFDAGEGTSVWIVDPNNSTVASRRVHVIRIGEERAVVAGDLHTGDKVVAIGAQLLKKSETVEVSTAPLTTAAK
jgi:multidrug efflux pump subunit AcrA (membrane-fusion protein)